MLHLTKMAVGVRDITHLRQIQQARAAEMPPLQHRTRNMPRRADEIRALGSIYWVIAGWMRVRQRIVDLQPTTGDDGSAYAALHLDAALVPVAVRQCKPFQGWRYLEAADAPADLAAQSTALGEDALPPALRQALQELCLL